MSSVSNINSKSVHLSPIPFPVSVNFKRIDYRQFVQDFHGAKEVTTDLARFSDQQSISSVEMNDCITIFGILRDADEKITEISAYHASSDTEEEEMLEKYFDSFSKKDSVSFYIIGGNKASTRKGGLLSTILETIENCFSNEECVKEQFTGINDIGHGEFSSANIQMDGTLTYCFHPS